MTASTHATSVAGIWLGVGMGGFADGIVFHQILQFHNMLSARINTDDLVGVKVNMIWDGLFHGLVWSITAIGICLLFRAARAQDNILSATVLVGAFIFGWGLFNVVEGVINHQLLHLHHVYEPAGQSHWDLVFLLWGGCMLLTGWLVMRAGQRSAVKRS